MSAWDYERIQHAKNAWAEARRLYPPLKPEEQAAVAPHPIRADGTGPQFT